MASNVTVSIQIVDENDNAPVFSFLNIQASAGSPINSIVRSSDNSPLVIRATDADSNRNALLVYQIVSPQPEVHSGLQHTGAIRQLPTWTIEAIAHFLFHVHVRDSGSPQLTAESPLKST